MGGSLGAFLRAFFLGEDRDEVVTTVLHLCVTRFDAELLAPVSSLFSRGAA